VTGSFGSAPRGAHSASAAFASAWQILKHAGERWIAHKCSRLGAALAYYSVFSLGPLLLIVTAVAGLFLGEDAVRGSLTTQFRSLLGDTGAKAVEAMLAGAASQTSGHWAAGIGVALLVVAALGVVVQLKDAMNTIWEADAPDSAGLAWYVRTYLVALGGILALGFLLAVSLTVSAALTAFSDRIGAGSAALGHGLNLTVSLLVLAALFALLFKWFPDAEVAWSHVWPAAIATSVLFNVGKLAIAWYIGTQALESSYGAAASIVVLLVWVYYSAQIVLFGAELAHAKAALGASDREPEVTSPA